MNTWTKQMGYPVLTVEGKQVIKGASPKLIGFIIQYYYCITRIFCWWKTFANEPNQQKSWPCDLTIAFWQGSCVFTRFCWFYCCKLINHREVRKCLMLAKHSSNTVCLDSYCFGDTSISILTSSLTPCALYILRTATTGSWPSLRRSSVPMVTAQVRSYMWYECKFREGRTNFLKKWLVWVIVLSRVFRSWVCVVASTSHHSNEQEPDSCQVCTGESVHHCDSGGGGAGRLDTGTWRISLTACRIVTGLWFLSTRI